MLNINSTAFNFSPCQLTVTEGIPAVFLDDYRYPLSDASSGLKTEELVKLFSPFLRSSETELTGPCGCIPLPQKDFLTVQDIAAILEAAMGFSACIQEHSARFTAPGAHPDESVPRCTPGVEKGLYWFEAEQRLIPYQLIVPKKRDARTALILMLHGGGGDPGSCDLDFQGTLAEYAEKYNCILFFADSFVRNSTFGCTIPPQGILDSARGMFPDTPEDRLGREISEKSVVEQVLYIRKKFGILPQRVFVAGNSMGGMGSFQLGKNHPDLFRAIAPAGAAPEISLFDYPALKNMPICFTAGCLDHHGFEHLDAAAKHMQKIGLNVQYYAIEEGTHPDAWVRNADVWFSFLVNQ